MRVPTETDEQIQQKKIINKISSHSHQMHAIQTPTNHRGKKSTQRRFKHDEQIPTIRNQIQQRNPTYLAPEPERGFGAGTESDTTALV
jgi:hypothetical protein